MTCGVWVKVQGLNSGSKFNGCCPLASGMFFFSDIPLGLTNVLQVAFFHSYFGVLGFSSCAGLRKLYYLASAESVKG